MRRVRAQDKDALRDLYHRHSAICYAICLRVLRDRDEAELVLTDVFAELWRLPDRYRPERGSVVGYLVVLARSRAIDRARARKLDRSRSRNAAMDVPVGGQSVNPAATIMADEQRALIRTAVEALPASQREVVELAFFGGMTHVSIAEKLARPEGTVKNQIRQGLIRLRDVLKEKLSFD